MKRLDRNTGTREGFCHLLRHGRNAAPFWQYSFSFSSGLPDLSRSLGLVRCIPSLTLPPERTQSDRVWLLVLSVLSAGFLASCGEISSPVKIPVNVTPISKVIQNPKVGSRVNVKGTVTQKAPFLDSGAYQIQDETGTIWVMRETPLPNSGDRVIIKGIVQYESVPIGQQDFGEVYLEEQKQLE
ncbi:MAG: hypothetical protein WBB29_20250 [Geitlerinemataceae cyanobacterium]